MAPALVDGDTWGPGKFWRQGFMGVAPTVGRACRCVKEVDIGGQLGIPERQGWAGAMETRVCPALFFFKVLFFIL